MESVCDYICGESQNSTHCRLLASCIVVVVVVLLRSFPIITIITTITLSCHFDACSAKKEKIVGTTHIRRFA